MSHKLISEHMLLEHEIVARLSDAVRTAIGWNHHGDLPRELSTVEFLVRSFARHAGRMMQVEEQDGFMDLLRKSAPDLEPQLDEFKREHQQFRQTLDRILARLSQPDAIPEGGTCTLLDELLALLESVDNHNKKEMDFLRQVLLHEPSEA